MHLTGSAERDQCHRHLDPRFEAHRGTGGDVEASPPRLIAIDVERRIGLREVDMTADLDRAITGVGDGQGDRRAPALSSMSPSAVITSPGTIVDFCCATG